MKQIENSAENRTNHGKWTGNLRAFGTNPGDNRSLLRRIPEGSPMDLRSSSVYRVRIMNGPVPDLLPTSDEVNTGLIRIVPDFFWSLD